MTPCHSCDGGGGPWCETCGHPKLGRRERLHLTLCDSVFRLSQEDQHAHREVLPAAARTGSGFRERPKHGRTRRSPPSCSDGMDRVDGSANGPPAALQPATTPPMMRPPLVPPPPVIPFAAFTAVKEEAKETTTDAGIPSVTADTAAAGGVPTEDEQAGVMADIDALKDTEGESAFDQAPANSHTPKPAHAPHRRNATQARPPAKQATQEEMPTARRQRGGKRLWCYVCGRHVDPQRQDQLLSASKSERPCEDDQKAKELPQEGPQETEEALGRVPRERPAADHASDRREPCPNVPTTTAYCHTCADVLPRISGSC